MNQRRLKRCVPCVAFILRFFQRFKPKQFFYWHGFFWDVVQSLQGDGFYFWADLRLIVWHSVREIPWNSCAASFFMTSTLKTFAFFLRLRLLRLKWGYYTAGLETIHREKIFSYYIDIGFRELARKSEADKENESRNERTIKYVTMSSWSLYEIGIQSPVPIRPSFRTCARATHGDTMYSRKQKLRPKSNALGLQAGGSLKKKRSLTVKMAHAPSPFKSKPMK